MVTVLSRGVERIRRLSRARQQHRITRDWWTATDPVWGPVGYVCRLNCTCGWTIDRRVSAYRALATSRLALGMTVHALAHVHDRVEATEDADSVRGPLAA